MIQQLALIACGGALGSLLRFAISTSAVSVFGRNFPYGTLLVNILGSCLIGVFYVLISERIVGGAQLRALAIIGLLGALTTFSTFSLETLQLLENGAIGKASLNIAANVGLCLVACWAGIAVTREF